MVELTRDADELAARRHHDSAVRVDAQRQARDKSLGPRGGQAVVVDVLAVEESAWLVLLPAAAAEARVFGDLRPPGIERDRFMRPTDKAPCKAGLADASDGRLRARARVCPRQP